MKRIIIIFGLLMAFAPAALASDDDRKQRALESVNVTLGKGYQAIIKEEFESTLYYRVCVHRKANSNKRRCFARTTNARGRDSVSLSGFVAKHGSGGYVVTWTGGGLEFGTKRFKA